MAESGVFGGNYFGNTGVKKNWLDFVPKDFAAASNFKKLTKSRYDVSINKYGVDCGMGYEDWMKRGWIKEQDPYGWYNWYINFYYGRRSEDDNRQIARWRSFIGRHSGMLRSTCLRNGVSVDNEKIGLKTRQGLLHWAYKIN